MQSAKCRPEKAARELHAKVRLMEPPKQPEPTQTGRASQIVAIIVAIGGLSALVAATAPIAHDFLQGEYAQCKVERDAAKGVLLFDTNQWKAAEDVTVNTNGISRKDSITLGKNTITNSLLDNITVKYDGTSPGIIESGKSVFIRFALEKPSTRIRLLVRPIHIEDK